MPLAHGGVSSLSKRVENRQNARFKLQGIYAARTVL